MTKTKNATRTLCETALLTVVTILLSLVPVPLPFTPVPITLGVFAVYTAGILLPPRSAFLSQLVYLLLGLAGLPVFSGFRGGIGHLLGPTGGFLFVYPLLAAVVAGSVQLYRQRAGNLYSAAFRLWLAATLLLATVLLYGSGMLWFAYSTGAGLSAAAKATVLPFLAVDIAKIAACVLCVLPVRHRLEQLGYLAH